MEKQMTKRASGLAEGLLSKGSMVAPSLEGALAFGRRRDRPGPSGQEGRTVKGWLSRVCRHITPYLTNGVTNYFHMAQRGEVASSRATWGWRRCRRSAAWS